MTIETLKRSGRVQLEQRDDAKPLTVVGYAAVFYRAGDPGTEYDLGYGNIVERIMPTAFDRALGLVSGQAADDVVCLFNHDPNMLLGRTSAGTLRLTRDATGLLYDTQLPDTTIASNLAENLRRQEINGSSFSFTAEKIVWIEEAPQNGETRLIRELHGVQVYDVGPVVWPAYGGTTAGLRSGATGPAHRSAELRAKELRAEFEAFKKEQQQGGANGTREDLEAARRRRAIRARIVELEIRKHEAAQ